MSVHNEFALMHMYSAFAIMNVYREFDIMNAYSEFGTGLHGGYFALSAYDTC